MKEQLIEKYTKPAYIGDGVYIHFDGYNFVLETLAQEPIHRISLEPEVIDHFLEYRDNCYREFEELLKKENEET